MAGAPRPEDLEVALRDAGFEQIVIEEKEQSRELIKNWLPGSGAERYVVSANVSAIKPTATAKPDAIPAVVDAMPARMRHAARRRERAAEEEAAKQLAQQHAQQAAKAAKGVSC